MSCRGSNSHPNTTPRDAQPPNASTPQCPPTACPPMEIEINDTPAVDDDLVQLKCERPAHRTMVNCRIRATSPCPTSSTVVLTNPDGRLRFPNAGDTTKTLTVPGDGSWVSFQISGETGSNAIGDAVIEAHCNTATGALKASKGVTVFWFDQAQIAVTPGGNYAMSGNRYTVVGGNAVSYSAQARIRPAGVNCAAPQVANLKIGIIQNNTAAVHAVNWGNPTVVWNPGVPSGTTINTPTTMRRTRSLPAGVYNDSAASVAPLYDQPGKAETLSANSLKPPMGCAGGAAATSIDTPSPTVPPFTLPATTAAGVNVGVVNYSFINTTMVDAFTTWAVVFDTGTNHLCALRERTWNLNVDSAAAGPQRATAAAADTAPTATPVTAPPFGVAVINNPANQAFTPTGTTTIRKP